jgi:hypothetical protein
MLAIGKMPIEQLAPSPLGISLDGEIQLLSSIWDCRQTSFW